jgi:hypothetical protein
MERYIQRLASIPPKAYDEVGSDNVLPKNVTTYFLSSTTSVG